MGKKSGVVIASAAAALILAGSAVVRAADEKGGSERVMCEGVNECKGKGQCATSAGGSCAGTNECKGKGVLSMTKDECLKRGGKISDAKM